MLWFNKFMKEAKVRNYHYDFVAFHWYRGVKVDAFRKALEELAAAHQRPVWLTEFNSAYVKSEAEKHELFLKGALKFLEESPVIGRYAYFNPKPDNKAALLDGKGKLTKLGEIYQGVGS